MDVRRLLVASGAAFALLVGFAGSASAGKVQPHDMLATPSAGTVGQHVTITNAANSKCGGSQGDGPAEVSLSIIKPDTHTETDVIVEATAAGNWSYLYTPTDQVGTYTVEGTCTDVPGQGAETSATDFDYTDATFDIAAAVVTTTTSTSTTSTTQPPATAPPAVAAEATPALTG